MSRPVLLDLFCGAGGAALGYYRAGFQVVGVDINPQPRYPFEFHQADAMTFPLDGFDAIHASPPCQVHTRASNRWRGGGGTADQHLDLLPSTRERLVDSGRPFALENVMGAPFGWAFVLCGWAFGLPMHRHRQFETRDYFLLPFECPGISELGTSMNPYNTKSKRISGLSGATDPKYAAAMGVDWMRGQEISEAIPPAYTEFIGQQLAASLTVAA